MKRYIFIVALALAALVGAVEAKNVDLVTLPDRDTVQLTIYNSEDITLVKETRHLTFRKGRNRMQFSWANTLIDPTSVELRILEHKGEIEIADTVFPGQKPQHLIWNLDSEYEGQVKVEVTYFTSGLTWTMDYVAVTDPAEESMRFTGYVRVYNRSGEEYGNAEVRLIVGNIHLVEKIADLARRRGMPVPAPASPAERGLRRDVAEASFAQAEKAMRVQAAPKQVVKEGISEYFMFSVAGRETLLNGWSKRMLAVESERTAFDILYRMRAHQYGPRPVRFFLWKNDEEHGLGESPLPDGLVRVFRENGREGLAFLGQQLIRYVPAKGEIEINLGPDDLVVYETRKARTERLSFQFRHGSVSGWDERTQWVGAIRNYRLKPIRFELHRQWPGHVEYESEHRTKLFDHQTVLAEFGVDTRGRTLYPFTVTTRYGTRASQSKIFLE